MSNITELAALRAACRRDVILLSVGKLILTATRLLIMASLWAGDDSKRWQDTLDRYEEACGAVPKKGDKLLPLDR